MGTHRSSFQQKVDWMIKHQSLWKGWPMGTSDKAIIAKMREDGLISSHSNDYDVGDFGKLVAEARSQLKKGKI